MSIRHLLAIFALAVVASVCSQKSQETSNATPTGPSVVEPGGPGGGVSRPAVVDFPARTDALDFRMQLESKYTSMGRRPAQTFVDMEGEATWIGEYDRYRVNGCDHDTATQRALSQIDGAAAGPVCAVRFFPETALYPPRDHVVDFRRQLGSKYQAMGRSAQSAVDQEGAAIWIAEYLRYRTSGCDHPTAVQRTLTQVDGNPAPATCLAQCAYYIGTPASPPSTGGTFAAEMIRTSGSCDWLAESEAPWITLSRPVTGGDRGILTYNVAANTEGPRSGTIRFNYPGGATFLEVNQGSTSVTIGFQFFDPATSTSPTTECRIRANQTVCTATAVSAVLPAPIATYDWRAEYAYGGIKVRTQVGASSSFSFTESCGASAAEGSVIPLSIRLTATDTAGNSATVFSGQGTQPVLQLRTFNCQ
jgi:Putative binding domain, N-terminal